METSTCSKCARVFSWDDNWFAPGKPARGWLGYICSDCDHERNERERHEQSKELEEARHEEIRNFNRDQLNEQLKLEEQRAARDSESVQFEREEQRRRQDELDEREYQADRLAEQRRAQLEAASRSQRQAGLVESLNRQAQDTIAVRRSRLHSAEPTTCPALQRAAEFAQAGMYARALEEAIEAGSILGMRPEVIELKLRAAQQLEKFDYAVATLQTVDTRIDGWHPWKESAEFLRTWIEIRRRYQSLSPSAIDPGTRGLTLIQRAVSTLPVMHESLTPKLQSMKMFYFELAGADETRRSLPQFVAALIAENQREMARSNNRMRPNFRGIRTRLNELPDLLLDKLVEKIDRTSLVRLASDKVVQELETHQCNTDKLQFNVWAPFIQHLICDAVARRSTDDEIAWQLLHEFDSFPPPAYPAWIKEGMINSVTKALPKLQLGFEKYSKLKPSL